jgi:hypothetical protein
LTIVTSTKNRSPLSSRTLAAITLTLLGVGHVTPARADDYDPESDAWNGLSELVALAADLDIRLTPSDRLDLGTLGPSDALVMVYPRRDPPLGALAAFMREGGRIALLDDYGRGDELLGVYRIGRRPTEAADAPHLRGNENLPVAQPTVAHALTFGVSGLVANHPTALSHDELDALFSFGDSGKALVLAGAVGDGRLVAVGDPSVLINNMLEIEDNRRFAGNLLTYLEGGSGGTIYLVHGDGELVGMYGEPGADQPFHTLSKWLERIAHAEAPPLAVLLGAMVLAALLLVISATALPRRSPYDDRTMFARPASSGGFVGRVGFFSRHRDDLSSPALVYQFELEGEIVQRLGVVGRVVLKDVVALLRARGLTDAEVADARSLFIELDDLRTQHQNNRLRRVSEQALRQVVRRGEHLLRRLDELSGHTAR